MAQTRNWTQTGMHTELGRTRSAAFVFAESGKVQRRLRMEEKNPLEGFVRSSIYKVMVGGDDAVRFLSTESWQAKCLGWSGS